MSESRDRAKIFVDGWRESGIIDISDDEYRHMVRCMDIEFLKYRDFILNEHRHTKNMLNEALDMLDDKEYSYILDKFKPDAGKH